MVTPQYLGDFLCRFICYALGNGRALDTAEVGLCEDAFHHRSERSQYQVILVHTHRVVAFLLQHAHHTEGDGFETDDLADGVATVGKQVIDNGLA